MNSPLNGVPWPLRSQLAPAAPGLTGLRPVLYAIACGSPVARYVGRLVALAHRAGWDVAVVTTPEGEKFVDGSALSEQTGHPVRSRFKHPADPDVLPAADAIVVAPATVNTVNKWAYGIADTLALGLLIEGHGLGLPIVAMPYTNTAMAAHPAFRESLGRLRSWGVRVLFGDDVLELPRPGTGGRLAVHFPWQLPLAALGPPRRAGSAPASGRRAAEVELKVWHRHHPAPGAGRPSPPRTPRPAPAIVRR